MLSVIGFGIISPAEDIVNGNAIIFGEANEHGIAGLSCPVFISADTVLVQVKVKSNLELCISILFS